MILVIVRHGVQEDPGSCNCNWCLLASLNVAAEVNLVRQLGDVHFEPVLDLVENLGVGLVAHEGDGQTLGTEPSSPGDSMEVGVCVLRHVIIEHNVDTLNIHS